jgi:delta 1-pyrroline-5-carboxylate dehydrogenase
LIQEDIFDVFVEKICSKIKTLKMGNGMDHSCSLGPLINTAQIHKVRHHTHSLLVLRKWFMMFKVKVNFTLEQAMKAQRWSRGIDLLFI